SWVVTASSGGGLAGLDPNLLVQQVSDQFQRSRSWSAGAGEKRSGRSCNLSPPPITAAYPSDVTGLSSSSCAWDPTGSFQPLSRTSKCTQSGPMNFSFGAFLIRLVRRDPSGLSCTCATFAASNSATFAL